jgi:ABC-type multidrug transport system permease subunit
MDVNPAEFLIDLVTIDTDDIHQAIIDESRINYLHRQFLQTCISSSSSSTNSSTGMPMIRNDGSTRDRSRRVSTLGIINRVRTKLSNGIRHTIKRFTLLLLRSWRQNIRNKKVILVRLCAVTVQAYLFSTIFASVQNGKSIPKSLADRIALLTYGVINLSMMSLMKSLDLFAKERRVVLREQMRTSYTSLEYIVAKVIAEIPLDASFALVFAAVLKTVTGLRTSMITLIKTYCLMTVTCATLGFAIGSFTSSVESAMTTGISVIVVLMVVGVINPSGVNLDDGPPNQIMQILCFFSPIKWAIESLVTAEFSGMIFEDDSTNKHSSRGVWDRLQDLPKMGALAFVKNGNDVLANLGLGKATYTELMTHLCLLSGIYLTISWIGLSFFRPTFI